MQSIRTEKLIAYLAITAVIAFALAGLASAQPCATQSPNVFPGAGVVKYGTSAVMGCTLTNNMASACFTGQGMWAGCSGAAFSCVSFFAAADLGATMRESCGWTCSEPAPGCTVTTDGPTDGLPVELMEFSVEPEESGEGEAEESSDDDG